MIIKNIVGLFVFSVFSLFAGAQEHIIIQAEDAKVVQGNIETEHAGFTGAGYFNFDNAVGKYVEWEFSMKNSSVESLFVVYAFSGSDRPLEVKVNDSVVVSSLNFVSTGAFNVWGVQKTLIPLRSGMNTLRLTSLTSSGGANLDRIELTGELGTMQYKLTTLISGKGSIVRQPDAQFYDAGSAVVLTAVPQSGSNFVSWSGGITGSKNPDTIIINGTTTVSASFKSFVHSVFYVSPSGNDVTGDGTFEKPFYSIQKAADIVSPGDTIFLRGGQYNYTTRINLSTVGSEEERITLSSVKGERSILDFSGMADSDYNQGIRLTGSYWHFYGLDIKGAGDNGLLIERNKPDGGTYNDIKDKNDEAHHNIIEYCNFYLNRDSGIQLKNLAAYNSIINCDAYFNRDAADGDADGFAPKLSVGTGNYFYGCRAWQNSDDGWDMYLKAKEDGFPEDMVTTIENCWAFQNGYLPNGTASKGNGNGFKLGGSAGKDQRHDVVLIRCLSFENLQKGFDQNSNTGNMTLINCTGFSKALISNASHFTYRIDGSLLAPGKKLVHTNNISIGDGLLRKDSKWAECEMLNGVGTTNDYLTSESDFITVDTTGARGPRKADGSLPDINFMKIKTGNTKLIDKGTVVDGISFAGIAPDLGAFETSVVVSVPFAEKYPDTYDLMQNYPNPFNPSTTISFALPSTTNARLVVYDMLGREIAILVDRNMSAGYHSIVWNASNVPSGAYIYRLQTEKNTLSQKMILTK